MNSAVRGHGRPIAIVGAAGVVAVVAQAAGTFPFFVDIRLFLAAWLAVLVTYVMTRASRDADVPDQRQPSQARRRWRSQAGLGLARAMVTFGVTAPLIVVILFVIRPGMPRGLYASPWLDVAPVAGLVGLLVGMAWMLVAWRSFLDEL